jgi:hypothetical protein
MKRPITKKDLKFGYVLATFVEFYWIALFVFNSTTFFLFFYIAGYNEAIALLGLSLFSFGNGMIIMFCSFHRERIKKSLKEFL